MTDAEHEQLQSRIQTIADAWQKPLGLRWWHISFYYHRDSAAFHESCPDDISLESMAYTSASWAYLDAAVHFNLPLLTHSDDTELEEMVVHEYMHIIVHEMRAGTRCDCEYDIRHEERVCTMLARAFVWTKEHFSHTADPEKTCTPQKGTVPDAG